jgi:hypothetical protein
LRPQTACSGRCARRRDETRIDLVIRPLLEAIRPAALCLVTAPPKDRRDAPYDDEYDDATGTFTYHYRRAQSDSARARMSAADNRSLKEALRLGVPLIN